MPDGTEPHFAPDRRGNRLERHWFSMAADGQSHRLFLRAAHGIVDQFRHVSLAEVTYRPETVQIDETTWWTHCLVSPGWPRTEVRDLANLLTSVITLPRVPGIEFALAKSWYKVAEEDVDPKYWRNTPAGQAIHVGKYWKESPAAITTAGRMIVRWLAHVVEQHPILATVRAIIIAPGHDNTLVSFGERLGVSLAQALNLPAIRVRTRQEFRLQTKNLHDDDVKVLWGEFSIPDDLTGLPVLVVDDVFHKGRTMSAVAHAARQAGATHVYGLAAVRTMRG